MKPGSNTSKNSPAIWTAALNTSVNQPRSRGRVKKSEIVHFPEFQKAAEWTDDPFWVDIFMSCSKKKFPRGFAYDNKLLRHRTNDIIIALPDDPQYFAQTAIYFFQENGKLLSERDQAKQKREEEQAIIEKLANASDDWSKVARSKKRRTAHVKDYVERKYSDLPKVYRDELFTQINLGFEDKYLNKDHIDFEEGQIEFIDGIDIDEEGVIHYDRPYPDLKISMSLPNALPKDNKYQHRANWHKFIDEYYKQIYASIKSSHTHQTVSYSSSGSSDGLNSSSTHIVIHSS